MSYIRRQCIRTEYSMKQLKVPALVLIGAIGLSGCAPAGEKETVGTVVGAVGGAVIGAQFGHGAGSVVGGAIGALIGGILGNEVGRSMDHSDKRHAHVAFTKASRVPVGETVYWSNSNSGHWGTFRPIRDGESARGYFCREFVTTVFVHGRSERMYGTACRHADGSWHAI